MRLATSGELDQLSSLSVHNGPAEGAKLPKNSHASESKVPTHLREGMPAAVSQGNGIFKELNLEEPKSSYEGDYVQPRWEDVKASTATERGSIPRGSHDLNLVLLSKEQKNGLVIKKFREFQRVEVDADNKSVSNRSVTSESSRINSVTFRPLRINGAAGEPSEVSVLKEVQRLPEDIKSEHKFEAAKFSALNDSKAFTEHSVLRQLELAVVGADNADNRSESLASRNLIYELAEVRTSSPAQPDPLAAPQQEAPVKDTHPPKEVTDPAEASRLLRGEIAEVVLEMARNGRFEGELIDGKMNGYGRLFDDRGRLVYEGDFVEDHFQGLGILHNHKSGSFGEVDEVATLEKHAIDLGFVQRAWDRYEGLFSAGRFHGRGYLFFGARFVLFARFHHGEIESGCCLRDLATNAVEKLDIYGPELIRRTN